MQVADARFSHLSIKITAETVADNIRGNKLNADLDGVDHTETWGGITTGSGTHVIRPSYWITQRPVVIRRGDGSVHSSK